jgi:hypothetical protein
MDGPLPYAEKIEAVMRSTDVDTAWAAFRIAEQLYKHHVIAESRALSAFDAGAPETERSPDRTFSSRSLGESGRDVPANQQLA